jgi:hypothetical protein
MSSDFPEDLDPVREPRASRSSQSSRSQRPAQSARAQSARARTASVPASAGTFTIILALVAVVLGVVILRSIGDPEGGSAGGSPTTSTTEPEVDPTETTAPEVTQPTVPPLVYEGATVVVANANRVNGSAGAMSRDLDAAGFTVAGAVNASADIGQLELTVVYYDASSEAARLVADSVNRVMGGDASVAPLPATIPTEGGQLVGQVLVLLGNDKGGKSLAELSGES